MLLNAVKQAYEIQLDMTSPQLASYVKIEVWDKQGLPPPAEDSPLALAELDNDQDEN